MHETRNFIMVLLAIGSFIWGLFAWFVLDPEGANVIWFQRVTSLLLLVSMAVWLVYAFQNVAVRSTQFADRSRARVMNAASTGGRGTPSAPTRSM